MKTNNGPIKRVGMVRLLPKPHRGELKGYFGKLEFPFQFTCHDLSDKVVEFGFLVMDVPQCHSPYIEGHLTPEELKSVIGGLESHVVAAWIEFSETAICDLRLEGKLSHLKLAPCKKHLGDGQDTGGIKLDRGGANHGLTFGMS